MKLTYDDNVINELKGLGVKFDKHGRAHYNDMTTDPYGLLQWTCGSSYDFITFDYLFLPGNYVALESVVNSETDHFIDEYHYSIVRWDSYEYIHTGGRSVLTSKAASESIGMVYSAQEWCIDNSIRFNRRESWKFASEIKRQVLLKRKEKNAQRKNKIPA